MDTAFAKPSIFKRLIKKANLAHIRYNYDFSPQAEDKEIYLLATKEKRIIITQDEGFKKQIKPKGTGILVIHPYLDSSQIDKILTKFISGKNPQDFIGKSTKI